MSKETNNVKRNACLLIAVAIITILIFGAIFITKEVSNAFKLVDEGLASSNESISKSNEALKKLLIKDEEHVEIVEEVELISKDFNAFIDSSIDLLVTRTGGWKENPNESELVNPKNMTIPTQLLVTNGLGEELKRKIIETRRSYADILERDLEHDSFQLPLAVNMEHMNNTGRTWSEYNFEQMPIMAILPIFTKFKNDENESKAVIYRCLANKKEVNG